MFPLYSFFNKMNQLNQREIKSTKCDTNGKIATGSCPHHYYILISKNKYNQVAGEVLGVPLTSKETNFSLNYGIDITNEDIDGDFVLTKEKTFVLCDRPCRVSKSDLKEMSFDGSRVSDPFFKRIVDRVSLFMRYGKCTR